jgi:lipoprotein-anchoring transpeptidase ErfK/SrfK
MSAPTIATPSPPSAEPDRPSRTRLALVIGLVLGVVVVLLAAILLYDHSRRDRIANGVTIDGVAVGGLSEAAASTTVQRELIGPLNEPVTVRSGHHTWTLDPRQAGVVVNAQALVARAVAVSREGSIFSRAFRDLFGGALNRDVKLHVGYSLAAVRALTAKVRAGVDRSPRDATVSASASGLSTVPSANGVTVEHAELGARVEHALAATGSGRDISVPTHVVKPAVTTSQLASRYPGYIVVDRAEFRLRFYEHLKLAKTYEIAVGMEGLETPAGLHHIEWEQVDPPWYVPNKAWAGSLAGTVVPPGPADPLKARFMSFEGGAGIHGIDPSEYSSIGHDASHGCIRMRIPDVIALYEKSPVGTPVYII